MAAEKKKKEPPIESLDLTAAPFIADIRKGLLEEGYFMVRRISLNVGKKQKPFLRLLLADKTGHLPAIFFDLPRELEKIVSEIREGGVIRVSGIMEEYQGILQLKLLKIRPAPGRFELSRFWKRTPHDRRVLYRDMKQNLEAIRENSLRALCFHFLQNRNFMKLFLEAPASRYVHHAYIGGLLEHTCNVLSLCRSYARIYPQADSDLLICGAFLHDIGKVDEYEYLLAIDHSSPGRLKGHTVLGYDRLQKALSQVTLAENLRLKVEHMLLSHQGKRIWGAVEEPRFLEAYLIHAADSTDSSQFMFSNAKRHPSADESSWSEYVSYLGREIYLG